MDNETKKFSLYLKCNLEIKKIMSSIPIYITSDSIELSNDIYKALKDIKFFLIQMITIYGNPNEKDYLNELFDKFNQELAHSSNSIESLRKFYQKNISNLSETIINEVGRNCIGYCIFKGISLNKGKTINELTHILHQRVINNERILESIPTISNKNNSINGESVSLRGNQTNLGKEIYDSFYDGFDIGQTEIISLSEDNAIIMVRDRGHALSIEVEKENNKYYVKYFIPKICNVNMVNELKGVRKVTSESRYTTGIFESTLETIAQDLISFIGKVPSDNDMIQNNYSK